MTSYFTGLFYDLDLFYIYSWSSFELCLSDLTIEETFFTLLDRISLFWSYSFGFCVFLIFYYFFSTDFDDVYDTDLFFDFSEIDDSLYLSFRDFSTEDFRFDNSGDCLLAVLGVRGSFFA